MALKVFFRPQAEADISALYHYIAETSGPVVAGNYIDRIEVACLSLATFPNRGDVTSGLCTITLERRLTIAYRVLKTRVEIVTIAYAGRDFESDLRGDDERKE